MYCIFKTKIYLLMLIIITLLTPLKATASNVIDITKGFFGDYGYITITSNMPDAFLYVNDKKTTSIDESKKIKLKIPAGEHKIVVYKESLDEMWEFSDEKSILVADNSDLKFSFNLEKYPTDKKINQLDKLFSEEIRPTIIELEKKYKNDTKKYLYYINELGANINKIKALLVVGSCFSGTFLKENKKNKNYSSLMHLKFISNGINFASEVVETEALFNNSIEKVNALDELESNYKKSYIKIINYIKKMNIDLQKKTLTSSGFSFTLSDADWILEIVNNKLEDRKINNTRFSSSPLQWNYHTMVYIENHAIHTLKLFSREHKDIGIYSTNLDINKIKSYIKNNYRIFNEMLNKNSSSNQVQLYAKGVGYYSYRACYELNKNLANLEKNKVWIKDYYSYIRDKSTSDFH